MSHAYHRTWWDHVGYRGLSKYSQLGRGKWNIKEGTRIKKRRNIWLNSRARGPANLGTFVSLLNEITSLNVPCLGVILVLDMEEKII